MKMRGLWKAAFISTILVILASLSAFACAAPAAPQASQTGAAQPAAPTIKIGNIDSFVGPAVRFGRDSSMGAAVAAQEVNAKGGIMGRQVEVLVRDNKLAVDQALRNCNELINSQKCVALVGIFSSGIALSVSDWCNQNKVPIVGYNCRSQRLTEELWNKYFFRTSSNTRMDGRNAAQYVTSNPKTKGWTNWALIGNDYEYGRTQNEAFKEELLRLNPNAKIVVEQWPKPGETDFTPYISALAAAKPDAIYGSCAGADGVGFIKQATAFGLFKNIGYVGAHEGGLSTLEPLGKDCADGLLLGTSYIHTYKPDLPQQKAFISLMQNATGDLPADYQYMGYVGMKMLLAAIQKAGATDSDSIVKALEGLSIDTPLGEKLTMRAMDHQADMGLLMGWTTFDKSLGYSLLSDVAYSPGAPAMLTQDEFNKIRQSATK